MPVSREISQRNTQRRNIYHIQGIFQGLSLKAKVRTKKLTFKAKARIKELSPVLKESLRTGPRPRSDITA